MGDATAPPSALASFDVKVVSPVHATFEPFTKRTAPPDRSAEFSTNAVSPPQTAVG